MKTLDVLSTIIIETLNGLLEEWHSESMPGALKLFWQQVMAQHLTETLFHSFSFQCVFLCVLLMPSSLYLALTHLPLFPNFFLVSSLSLKLLEECQSLQRG